MRIADLPPSRPIRRTAKGIPESPQPVLWCRRCNDTYSATPGDYADRDPDDVLSCSDCGGPFVLVETRMVHVPYDEAGEGVAWLHFLVDALWNTRGKGVQ